MEVIAEEELDGQIKGEVNGITESENKREDECYVVDNRNIARLEKRRPSLSTLGLEGAISVGTEDAGNKYVPFPISI